MLRMAAYFRLVLFLALAGILGFGYPAVARESERGHVYIATVARADLPAEARHTLVLIQRGGPFPYPHKDGSIFGNFEKRLPFKVRGYYREYTVPTPGRRDRGARRIIAGSGTDNNVATSGEYYYTDNHYRSFRQVGEP